MGRLIAKELKLVFIENLMGIDDFSYEAGNPFLIRIKKKEYFVFIKNLSPAYFKNSPDVTRVQLPYSSHFSKIVRADIPFMIFGYDNESNTIVTWNPNAIKERLNAKSNVSLYSRKSLQQKVKSNEYKVGYLSNGDRIVLFKRDGLKDYFSNYRNLFSHRKSINKVVKTVNEPSLKSITNKLTDITDAVLLKDLKVLLNKNQVLKAVELVADYYSVQYRNMSFQDWFSLVKTLQQKWKL